MSGDPTAARDGQGASPPAGPRAMPDMPALTSLRAVAALLVFLFHFPPWGLGYVVDVVISQGHVGVTVFFVLSGFLITVRYYPQFEAGRYGLADYFVRRAARILPLYYVVLVLTHVLSTGAVPLGVAHLPEWTLTHALLGSHPDALTVPTSWSLTVEECFYASAPLLFLAIAALRRRFGATGGALGALAGAALLVHLAGTALLQFARPLRAADLLFLSEEVWLRSYTVFGRFPEFVLGAAAGVLFLSGRVAVAWSRPRGGLLSTTVALGGATLLVAAQEGMVRDVGVPAALWWWNVAVAAGAALVVLALTCGHAPLSRALAWRPLVYLGRISYAMYLIQLTPLGRSLWDAWLPGHGVLYVLLLYMGMSLVSALLFELVEEPVRDAILGSWRRRRTPAPTARPAWPPYLSLAVLLLAMLVQYGAWVGASLEPVGAARALRVLGSDSEHVLVVPDVGPEAAGEPRTPGARSRIYVPPSWREGPDSHPRAPSDLLVYFDGKPVPFLGVEHPANAEPSAYYRRARADYLRLQTGEPVTVTVVHQAPGAAFALAWSRVREEPALATFPVVLLGAAWFLWRRRPAWTPVPRRALALAVGLITAWLVLGLHLRAWAPLILAMELGVLLRVPPTGNAGRLTPA